MPFLKQDKVQKYSFWLVLEVRIRVSKLDNKKLSGNCRVRLYF